VSEQSRRSFLVLTYSKHQIKEDFPVRVQLSLQVPQLLMNVLSLSSVRLSVQPSDLSRRCLHGFPVWSLTAEVYRSEVFGCESEADVADVADACFESITCVVTLIYICIL
jgi:hypothetical protein